MGGTIGLDPAAITKRRARILASPASTVRSSVKRACSVSTVTPSPSKRSD